MRPIGAGKMKKTLVAWFSHAGQNYLDGAIAELAQGNCETLARAIIDKTGADGYRIQEAQAHPNDYRKCIDRAKKEQQDDARPALAAPAPDLSGYEVVILVYPNWWGDLPMPVRTFLDEADTSGKTLAPLCSNEGSGMGVSQTTLRKACPKATIAPGLSLLGHKTAESLGKAVKWAQERIA